jgi:hypothetical protein
MTAALTLMAAIVAVGALYVVLPVIGHTLRLFRGSKPVVCPENGASASVRVDLLHAAATAALSRPELRLSGCTRWPERGDCGRECLRGIA